MVNTDFDSLVSTEWLAVHLQSPGVKVIDGSWYLPDSKRNAKEEYLAGHIPGAVFFDIDDVADSENPLPHMLPSPEKFTSRMRKLGLGDGDRIVVYDGAGVFSSARAWWTFRVFGHEDVAVLDGGLPKWRAEGRPENSGSVTPTRRHFTAHMDSTMVRALADIQANLESPRAQVVDARSRRRFAGSEPEPRPGLRPGHVPNSINLPYTELVDPKTGTMRPVARLKEIFATAGIDSARPVITSCGSGITAALVAFALDLVGHREVSLYDGSWTEWGARQDTPVSRGDRPWRWTAPMKTPTHPVTGARVRKEGYVNPAVHHASTVLFPSLAAFAEAQRHPFDRLYYGRHGTPTSFAFEEAMAELEGGYRGLATSSGMAAVSVALMAFLNAGDHLLMVDSVYNPVRSLCDRILSRLGISVTYYDPLIGAGIGALMRPETRVVYLESPGSMTFEMQDVPAIAATARAGGAVTIMDNTWATPLFFKPLSHGVDVSLHSVSKYIAGHSDLVMGIVTTNENVHIDVRRVAVLLGSCPGPDDCYLAQRGLRTLAVRMRQHQSGGIAVARWLAERPEVSRVLHPALPGDPGHPIWRRDFSGAGGLFGVVLEPVSEAAVAAMIDGLGYFGIGVSWGGFESLALSLHPERYRSATNWRPGGPTLRFHIGLEDPDDLIADLESGFERLNRRA